MVRALLDVGQIRIRPPGPLYSGDVLHRHYEEPDPALTRRRSSRARAPVLVFPFAAKDKGVHLEPSKCTCRSHRTDDAFRGGTPGAPPDV